MSIFKQSTSPAGRKDPKADARAAKTAGLRTVDRRNKNLKLFSISSTALFLIVLLVFNLVFDSLFGEKLKWDWSSGELYTVGAVSKEILKTMDKDVEIIGLFDEAAAADYSYTSVLPMIDDYVSNSGGHVTQRFVDPDKTPAILKTIDPNGYLDPQKGEFVVRCAATGKAKTVGYDDIFDTEVDYTTYQTKLNGIIAEQSLTGAIKYVLSATTPVVYFTSGHDELDYTQDYSTMVTILKNNNFDVKSLELFNLTEIPTDCATLIIADPQKDLTQDEGKLVGEYLRTGGGLMVISDYSNVTFPQLNSLLASYDLELTNNKVREGDKTHRYNDDPYFLRAIAPVSSLTTELVDGFTLADNIRAVASLNSGKEYIAVEPVLTSSEQGIQETNGDAAVSSAAATQNIALISENSGFMDGKAITQPARVMLMGSTSIFGTELIDAFGGNIYNAGIFYYSVRWLANESAADSLYIAAKSPPSYTVTSGSTSTNVFVALLTMILIPGALLLLALLVYRKRRHL